MSGSPSFYRPRILGFSNIPQIEEGSIVGFIPQYRIAPSLITVTAPDSIALTDDTAVLTSVDSIDSFAHSVPTKLDETTVPRIGISVLATSP